MKNSIILLLVLIIIPGYCQEKKLSLDEAVELGLKNNPLISASSERINFSSARLWSGISLPPPELSVSFEYIPIGTGLQRFGERTIEVVQSMEFPTNYFLRGSKLSKETGITENEHSLNILKVTSRIKAAYFEVLASREQLKNAEDNLQIARDFHEKAEIRYNVGEGSNLEKLTAKVQHTEAQNNLDIQKNKVSSALIGLNFALGNGSGEMEEYYFTDSLEHFPVVHDEILNESVAANVLIKINELRLSISEIDRNLAWSSILPQLSLSYFRQSLGEDNNYYGVSFGVSVPLWFMFDNRGQIEESAANLKIAEAELQSVKNELSANIKTAFYIYKNEKKQYELHQTEIIPEAEEIFRIAELSFQSGEITYLEFLQAKQILINSKSNYINVLLSLQKSIILLEEAAGIRLI